MKYRIQDRVFLLDQKLPKFEDQVNAALKNRRTDRPAKEQEYVIGFEYQITDNAANSDAQRNGARHQTAALYDMFAASKDVTRPVGEFNHSRLVVKGDHIEHWLNGEKVVDASLKAPEVAESVAKRWGKDSPVYHLLAEPAAEELPGVAAKSQRRGVVQEHSDQEAVEALFEVFDEQHGIPALVVDQLVHQVAGHENAESARPLALLHAHFDVLDRRILGIGNRRMRQEVEGETGAGVVNMHDQGAFGAQEGNPHPFSGIRLPAVLDGIHEQLAKRGHGVFAGFCRNVDLHFAQELRGALGGIHLAAHFESDPVAAGRSQADVVFPGRGIQGLLHHVVQLARGHGIMEVAIGVVADSAQGSCRIRARR